MSGRGRTTIRVPGVRVADDLVKRDFHPAAPDVLWVADITYLRSWEGSTKAVLSTPSSSVRLAITHLSGSLIFNCVVPPVDVPCTVVKPPVRGGFSLPAPGSH